jgi:tetratricopeptide (TPR) repeat protein
MGAAWRQGRPVRVEDLLHGSSELNDPRAAVRLIYEEVCLRRELGQPVSTAEVLGRFPQWRAELEEFFACCQLLQPEWGTPAFPQAGETLGDFHLLAEMGRGGNGRVFLATQPLLADRPVVLKLTPLGGQEHLSLARLQHTHIVPLYWAQDFPGRKLRALCMPYLGGATLAQLLDRLRGEAPKQGGGQAIQQAVCWIGSCLAEALHYAHQRGLVHLDLKPANVLLAADGQPMLLDFHLAREPVRPGEAAPEWLGGTPGYMAPEQQRALEAVRLGRPVPTAVDGQADLYALGVLLYEVLAGRPPRPLEAPPARLERWNREVSTGLADLLHKCLAREPRDRYPDAAALAADLRRHLANLPLRGVANRSLVERCRKWRRRQPHLFGLTGMLLATLLAVLTVASVVWTWDRSHRKQRLREAEAALAGGRALVQGQRHAEAVRTLTHGLAVAEQFAGDRELRQALETQLRLARRAGQAHHLHLLAERLRFLFGVDLLPPSEGRALEHRCRELWAQRRHLIESSGQDLGPEAEGRVRVDLLDLAIIWPDLRVRLAAGGEVRKARQEALELLAEAEAVLGPSPILYHERHRHARALGLHGAAEPAARAAAELAPRNAWEHYALGRSLLRAGELARAADAFRQALDLRPQAFWANFYSGLCAYRLGRHGEAVAAFHACVVLAPREPVCYYNRALAHTALGSTDQALRDYDRALQLDPRLVSAALNRGLLHYRAKRYAAAMTDFRRALENGADPAVAHYHLGLVHLARGEYAAARASLQHALRYNPSHKEARDLLNHDRLAPSSRSVPGRW